MASFSPHVKTVVQMHEASHLIVMLAFGYRAARIEVAADGSGGATDRDETTLLRGFDSEPLEWEDLLDVIRSSPSVPVGAVDQLAISAAGEVGVDELLGFAAKFGVNSDVRKQGQLATAMSHGDDALAEQYLVDARATARAIVKKHAGLVWRIATALRENFVDGRSRDLEGAIHTNLIKWKGNQNGRPNSTPRII